MFEKLEKELSAQEWGKANKTTQLLLCSLVNRSTGTLTVDDIKKISFSDLYQIDRNWTKYSNNRFGFSIQKQIWHSKGYDVLVREAKWSVNEFFPIADFSLNSPVGQLPYLGASSFWVVPVTSKHSSLSHTHRPHYHYHPPSPSLSWRSRGCYCWSWCHVGGCCPLVTWRGCCRSRRLWGLVVGNQRRARAKEARRRKTGDR